MTMEFPTPLTRARLERRYKRFLSDMTLADGSEVVAHCPNPGAMTGLAEPGMTVWVSKSTNPKRKLGWTWELTEVDDGNGPAMVGIHASRANGIVGEALKTGAIAELSGYESIRSEVKYGENSRIDFLLESQGQPPAYVEIKNVHLCRQPYLAEFPDCPTARGAKHLGELANMVRQGARAVMLYVVQRPDNTSFRLASDIDPTYAKAFAAASEAGVESLCYDCDVDTENVKLRHRLDFAAKLEPEIAKDK